MTTFNKSDFRSITINHSATGEARTFYVKFDGTEIISAARKIKGNHKRAYTVSQCAIGGNAGTKIYRKSQRTAVNFHSSDSTGKNRNMNLYTNRLVWAAWNNNGVMPPAGQSFHVDHVDGNHRNEHYSNLELVTNTENQRRKNERLFQPMMEAA